DGWCHGAVKDRKRRLRWRRWWRWRRNWSRRGCRSRGGSRSAGREHHVDPVARVLIGIVRERRRAAIRKYAVRSLSLPGLKRVQRGVVRPGIGELSRRSGIARVGPVGGYVGGVGGDRYRRRESHGLPARRSLAGKRGLPQHGARVRIQQADVRP